MPLKRSNHSQRTLVTKSLGRHLLVELYGCDRARLDDADYLKSQSIAAAKAMGAQVVAAHAHRFQPHGVSVVVVLAESHLALHTWPEHGTASIDIFVCSQATDPHQATAAMANGLCATETAELELSRGDLKRTPPRRWRRSRNRTTS